MGGFYETHPRTLYRFRVVTQAQAGGYPSSLNSHVTHHVSIPIGQRPQSCQVLCPRDGKVELNISMKLGRELLKPETFINSSLLAEVVDLLQVVIQSFSFCFKTPLILALAGLLFFPFNQYV